MATELSLPIGRPLLLRGGRVIDPSASRDDVADVLLRDGLVVDVAHGLGTPDDAHVIDVSGLVVCPGLIDLHVHPRPHYYGWFLASGVTTVRSANTTTEMARALNDLPAPHARLVWAGPMLDGENSIIKRFYPEATPDAPSPARAAVARAAAGRRCRSAFWWHASSAIAPQTRPTST